MLTDEEKDHAEAVLDTALELQAAVCLLEAALSTLDLRRIVEALTEHVEECAMMGDTAAEARNTLHKVEAMLAGRDSK